MNTIKREVLLIALIFIGASIATPVEKVSRGLTFSSPFLVSGSLSVLPSQTLKGGGSKANFFGGSDLSFGHHRCP